MTERQFVRLLQRDVDAAPSQRRVAERLDITESMLSRVLTQKSPPSDALLAKYGLTKVVAYVRLRRVKAASQQLNESRSA